MAMIATMDPEQVGPYRLGEVLGRGGMGTVYRALPVLGGAPVAIKLIRTDLAAITTVQRRFLRETRALCALRSPQVVRCLDFGWDPPVLWMAMELMTGGDLAARLRRDGPLAPDMAVRAICDAAAGVQAMHDAGLLHRDLKPANLFCAEDGAVKVADLGLVRFRDDAEDLTALGDVIGTPAYLAPEQAQGAATLDARCDVYSLGATLYALLSGRPPFSGGGAFAVVAQVLRDPPPPLADLVPGLPAHLVAAVEQAMAKAPAQRFASATDFARALSGPPVVGAAQTNSTNRRQVVAATLVVLAMAGAALALRPSPQPATPPSATVESPAAMPAPEVASPSLAAPTSATTPVAVPLAPVPAPPVLPAWAVAAGHDRWGDWGDLRVAGATQRMRRIPAGTFTAGSPADESGRLEDERQRTVRFSHEVWMADTECTVALWAALSGGPAPTATMAVLPCVDRTWEDIQTALKRHAGRWPGMVLRLPTDMEWEYACRAGTTGSFGVEPATGAWLADNAGGVLHPVGLLAPNAWGLFDCHGNAREWCGDGYAASADDSVDPVGDGYKKVVRGGSFRCRPAEARSALRLMERPGAHSPTLGFRLVLAPAG
jgi:hypothetical protein